VLLARRVVGAKLCLACGECSAKGEVRGGRALQVRLRARGELLRVDPGVVKARELLDQAGVARQGPRFH
jgi:hypothetical protein